MVFTTSVINLFAAENHNYNSDEAAFAAQFATFNCQILSITPAFHATYDITFSGPAESVKSLNAHFQNL